MGLFDKTKSEDEQKFLGFKVGDMVAYRSIEAEVGESLKKGKVARIEEYTDDIIVEFFDGTIVLEDEISWWVLDTAEDQSRAVGETGYATILPSGLEKYGF